MLQEHCVQWGGQQWCTGLVWCGPPVHWTHLVWLLPWLSAHAQEAVLLQCTMCTIHALCDGANSSCTLHDLITHTA